MSDDHIGVKVNGVLYVKLEDARKLRQGWDKADERIDKQAAEITRLRAKVDAVYSERNRLAAAFARMALAAGFKAGKGVDPDETKWPVVYVDTPNGQVSWHIAESDQDVLEGLPQYDGEWDGTFTAREPLWPVWLAADLIATARRDALAEIKQDTDELIEQGRQDGMEQAAKIALAMSISSPSVIAAAIRAAAKEQQ